MYTRTYYTRTYIHRYICTYVHPYIDRGRGLNEIGHYFLCNKSAVLVRTRRTRSGSFARLQYRTKYKVNEMRGRGFKLPHKAQVINKSRRSYIYICIAIQPYKTTVSI